MQVNTKKTAAKDFLGKYVIYIMFIIMVLGLSIFTDSFFSINNFQNVLRQSAVVGVLSLGMTYILIIGGIDLSVGSIMAFASCVTASFCTNFYTGLPLWLAILIGVAAGAVIGLINGYIIAGLGIVPFIATLGTQTAVRGMTLVYTNGRPINSLIKGYIGIGQGFTFGIPNPVIIFIVLSLIAWFVLSQTKYGRYLYAIGGNEEAAVVSGLNVKKLKLITYTINGAVAAIAGIMLSARVAVGSPTAGETYELQAITAVVIGGTSNAGGTGGIMPTIIGVLIMGILNNGMDLLGLSGYYQKVVTGLIIIFAVVIDRNNVNRNH